TTSSIQIAWNDNSNDETGFMLERSEDGGSYSSQAILGPNVTGYTDSYYIYAGHNYSYRVRAYNDSGDSAFSNIVTGTAQVPPPSPAAPTNLVATAASSTQI